MRSRSRASKKIGLAPGSLVHVGHPHEAGTRITVVEYGKDRVVERQIRSVAEIRPPEDKQEVTWINVEGLHDVALIDEIGRNFSIHPLVLEDILNTHQRPKFDEFENYLFIALKLVSLQGPEFTVQYEQISIVLMKCFVLTFREKADDFFLPLKKRLADEKGRLRSNGADYLTYAILDAIVDQYFALQDSLDTIIDTLDEELMAEPTPSTLTAIQGIKRELIFVRKTASPLRELLAAILHSDTGLIREKIMPYLRDVYDHSIRITEAVDTYRDMVTGMMEVYLSSISNRTNEIMKVLTVFASIFIPLTFIAGIYGMNFEYMPELKWKWAYPALWACFVLIPVVLLAYFRKKKWL